MKIPIILKGGILIYLITKPDGVVEIEGDIINVVYISSQLARIPRFAAATNRFYSVAEHSCRVACEVFKNNRNSDIEIRNYAALRALMHDAHEILSNDITAPYRDAMLEAMAARSGGKVKADDLRGYWKDSEKSIAEAFCANVYKNQLLKLPILPDKINKKIDD